LDRIKQAFDAEPNLENLLFAPYFRDTIERCDAAWRDVVSTAIKSGIPTPCFSAALAYFDGIRRDRLPANLLQAQRDYFGAHTYERTDKPRAQFSHTDWLSLRRAPRPK
jgi:6-phosphogluconate dehydrogenase